MIRCKIIICFSLKFLGIRSNPEHEEALDAMIGSGRLRNLKGLALKHAKNFKVHLLLLFSLANLNFLLPIRNENRPLMILIGNFVELARNFGY